MYLYILLLIVGCIYFHTLCLWLGINTSIVLPSAFILYIYCVVFKFILKTEAKFACKIHRLALKASPYSY